MGKKVGQGYTFKDITKEELQKKVSKLETEKKALEEKVSKLETEKKALEEESKEEKNKKDVESSDKK